jgi:hypothetical protein
VRGLKLCLSQAGTIAHPRRPRRLRGHPLLPVHRRQVGASTHSTHSPSYSPKTPGYQPPSGPAVNDHVIPHDGNVTERDDNAKQTLASVTKNSQGVPTSWSFTQTAPPDVNILTYDPADWPKTQVDQGTTSTCTDDQQIATSWTPDGQEDTQTIKNADSSCAFTIPKQTTNWKYFDNGNPLSQTTSNGQGTVLETHTLGYETNGVYMDGNRTSDAYSLNGPGSTVCTGGTPSCTATYTGPPAMGPSA